MQVYIKNLNKNINDEVRKSSWTWLGRVFRMQKKRHRYVALKWNPSSHNGDT